MGEISESFEYGLNAAATEYDGKHKYIRITDIDDSTHLFLQDNLTSPDVDFSTVDDYLLQKGDVLFARTGASVGKTYIYRPSDGDLYFAGFLIRAKIKSDYDADFIFQNTLTDNYDSYIRITSQRSGQPGVNAQEYANFALSVPCLAEQKKIGAYFTNLDNLITLHQRKYIHYLLYHFSTKNAIIFDEFFLLPIPFYHISRSEFAQLQKIPGKFRGFLIIQIFLHTSPTCGNRQYSSFFRECGESS